MSSRTVSAHRSAAIWSFYLLPFSCIHHTHTHTNMHTHTYAHSCWAESWHWMDCLYLHCVSIWPFTVNTVASCVNSKEWSSLNSSQKQHSNWLHTHTPNNIDRNTHTHTHIYTPTNTPTLAWWKVLICVGQSGSAWPRSHRLWTQASFLNFCLNKSKIGKTFYIQHGFSYLNELNVTWEALSIGYRCKL